MANILSSEWEKSILNRLRNVQSPPTSEKEALYLSQAAPYEQRAKALTFTPTQIQQFAFGEKPLAAKPTESQGLNTLGIPQGLDFQISPFANLKTQSQEAGAPIPSVLPPMPNFQTPQAPQPQTAGYHQSGYYGRAGGGYGVSRRTGFAKSF